MDNETLDKVFNLVFGRYKQVVLFPDNSLPTALTHMVVLRVIIAAEDCEIGDWIDLWIGPKPAAYQLCLTQFRLRVADSTMHQWRQSSCFIKSRPSFFRGYYIDKLDYSASAIEMRRAVADAVVGLFTAWHCKSTGLRLVEDCDNSRAVLDVSSLEELLVKADLTA